MLGVEVGFLHSNDADNYVLVQIVDPEQDEDAHAHFTGRESQGKQGGCVDSHTRTDCRRAGVRQEFAGGTTTLCHTFVGPTGISLRPEELEHLSSVFDTYVANALNTEGLRSSERSFESLTLFPPRLSPAFRICTYDHVRAKGIFRRAGFEMR